MESYNIKQITKNFEYCNRCGMLLINCICSKIEIFESIVEIWILTLEREIYRPSNTAKLLKLVNPSSTKLFFWQRKVEPEGLTDLIKSSQYDVFLLFPVEKKEDELRRVDYKKSKKKTAFIIIDGTWKEARRILNKSSYLNDLPIVSIENETLSQYKFRRGAAPGQLCTYEAALEVLNMNDENGAEKAGRRNFEIFLSHFKATINGHRVHLD